MSFAYPEFLFALAAVSVPIVIHLFNFRRFKKVYFSDIRFLKDVEIETKSRNKLKNLLILLSRILAIIFLVMAFARPFIPTGSKATAASNSVLVYIDNSFSMSADGEAGSLLEEAKAKAIEVGSAYANGAELHLLTNDFLAAHFRSLSFEEFKNEVASVQSSPQLRNFDDVVSRASSVFDAMAPSSLYFISDLQAKTATPRESSVDSLLSIYIVPVQSEFESNIYIDSCWFDSPSRLSLQPDNLNVRIRNAGSKDIENLSVKLALNGVQRSVGTTTVSSKAYEDVVLNFTNAASGLQRAEVSIQDYPITYDDHYYMSFNLANAINILSVNGQSASNSAAKLFDSEPNFTVTQVSEGSLDYSVLNTTDLVILNEVPNFSSGMIAELMKFVSGGGSLLFIPAEKPELSSTNELLLAIGAEQFTRSDSSKLKVEGVNLKSKVFKNVFTQWEERIDLPAVSKHFGTQTRTTASSERLLTLANGESLLTSYRNEKGNSYVLSAPLRDSWTNFHRHALFVPAFYNIALNSVTNGASAEIIGSNELIPISSKLGNAETLEISNSENSGSFIPERVSRAEGNGVYVHDQIRTDGHYLLLSGKGDTLKPLSFNFNRAESDMNFLTADEFTELASELGITNLEIVEASTESLANQVREMNDGKQLWRLFLILALLCLLFETVLIRIL
ncbi:MAG: BatA domain-containing protein [Flavobacteriales bacterium]|nr:BatA domain-containing protein [Flavobacteriales bacterium]